MLLGYAQIEFDLHEALERLVRNLADDPIPLPLISQYLPGST